MKNPAEGIKALKEVNAKAAETYHRALTEQEQKDLDINGLGCAVFEE